MNKLGKAALLASGLVFLVLNVTASASEAQSNYHDDMSIDILSPSTWFSNMPAAGTTMEFNPAHPAGWAVIMNPRTHTSWHMAFTNPATYTQFMKPQFYMQFMNPKNWIAWMNPASYATFMDPNTYLYWMTPHAYVHALNPDNYLQMFDTNNYLPFLSLDTYGEWVNPAAYSFNEEPRGTVDGGALVNYLVSWFGSEEPKAPAAE